MTDENLTGLMAALPAGDDTAVDPGEATEQLQIILADLAYRPVPIRSLHRLWTLGELSAQIALAYTALWVREFFADAETRQRRVMETNLKVALKMFRHLGYLRGAFTKLGQTAGNLRRLLPDQLSDVLDRLHFEAPPMHYSLIREVVYNEFGKGPEEVFARFDKDAFAAASLGQVHRAQLKTGEDVAVKIQYPGIGRTIDADFRNLGALLFPLRLGKDWEYTKAQFDEVHRMLNQEIDYRQEAESMERARALFGTDEGIVVPRVYGDYSTGRVLTAEYLPGLHLNGFLATNPSQSLRNDYGAKLYRAALRFYYAYMQYGDPNPGNYVFMSDGRLGLLDFGCIQYYGSEERRILALCERLIADDESVVPELLEAVCGVKPGDPDAAIYENLTMRARNWMMEPMRVDGPFDFGDEEHLKRGFAWITDTVRKHKTRGHPMYVYYNREVFGLGSLLYRLRAEVDARRIYEQESAIWLQRESQA